jgi:hypothetical protein
MLLVLIAAVIIFALGGADSALSLRSANARQTQNLFTSILLWLWMGYPQLAMAGFAEDRWANIKPHAGAQV